MAPPHPLLSLSSIPPSLWSSLIFAPQSLATRLAISGLLRGHHPSTPALPTTLLPRSPGQRLAVSWGTWLPSLGLFQPLSPLSPSGTCFALTTSWGALACPLAPPHSCHLAILTATAPSISQDVCPTPPTAICISWPWISSQKSSRMPTCEHLPYLCKLHAPNADTVHFVSPIKSSPLHTWGLAAHPGTVPGGTKAFSNGWREKLPASPRLQGFILRSNSGPDKHPRGIQPPRDSARTRLRAVTGPLCSLQRPSHCPAAKARGQERAPSLAGRRGKGRGPRRG